MSQVLEESFSQIIPIDVVPKAVATQLTLSIVPQTVESGSQATFSGRLTRGDGLAVPDGTPILIEKMNGAYIVLYTAYTFNDGYYTTTETLDLYKGTHYYRSHFLELEVQGVRLGESFAEGSLFIGQEDLTFFVPFALMFIPFATLGSIEIPWRFRV